MISLIQGFYIMGLGSRHHYDHILVEPTLYVSGTSYYKSTPSSKYSYKMHFKYILNNNLNLFKTSVF